MLMLLCRNAAYSLLGAASYVTPSLTLPCSAVVLSLLLRDHLTHPLQLFKYSCIESWFWYFISYPSLHWFSSMCHSCSLTGRTPDGSSLSVARQGALSSNSFHILNVSYVPNLTVQHCSLCHHDCSEVDSKKRGERRKTEWSHDAKFRIGAYGWGLEAVQ